MPTEKTQWIIVAVLFLIFTGLGVWCYVKSQSDSYLYDPAFKPEEDAENVFIKNYFDQNADVQYSLHDRRALMACDNCRNSRLTPELCQQCISFIKGRELLNRSGV